MERKNIFLFGLLVGAIAMCFVQAIFKSEPQSAYAQTANANNRMIAATGQIEQGLDALYLVDTDPANPRLLVYESRQGRTLKLIGVRDLQWDLRMIDWVNTGGKGGGSGDPPVLDVKEEAGKNIPCAKCGKKLKDCKCR
jgi:hypothetical protein